MIYLIRHLKSEANVKNIIGGDYPLSDEGIRDGEKMRAQLRLNPDVLVASPLIRAQQTAQILFPGKEFIIDPAFREIHCGDYEGTVEADNEFQKVFDTTPSRLHEVTHGDVIQERADRAVLKLLDYFPKGEVVIVCHEALIRAIICKLRGESFDNMPKYKPLLSNGSMLKLNLSESIEIINDTGCILI